MRSIIICTAAVMAIFAADARTHAQAKWCAVYQNGGTNCGFATQEQCLAAASGSGSFCNQSGEAGGSVKKSKRTRRALPMEEDETETDDFPSVEIDIGDGYNRRHPK
jgi:hypothetical protein